MASNLIIIQGPSGTGKTRLARELGERLSYPVFAKDAFKEKRFDEFGRTISLKEWANTEFASWEAMFERISQAASSGSDLIVEGNFKRRHTRKLKTLLMPETNIVELYCFAKGWVPFRRYVARTRSGERHWGHRDYLWGPLVWCEVLFSQFGLVHFPPLNLTKDILRVDATDFGKVDYDVIEKEVRRRLAT